MTSAIPTLCGENVFETMEEYKGDGLAPKEAYKAASHLHRKVVYDMRPEGEMGRMFAKVDQLRDRLVIGKLDAVPQPLPEVVANDAEIAEIVLETAAKE